MIIPAWAVFGLLSAAFSALMMLMQEKLKVDGYALAFWNKVTCATVMLPFVIVNGLPQNPLFYLFLGIGACMYAVSDVVFFRAIPKVGAGIVSRLLPGAVILSFMLWFAVKPDLLMKYLADPIPSALIFIVLCLSVWFSMHLKKCAVSMEAVRAIWFVIFAATVGPILAKTVTGYADIGQGPFAYVFIEALMMVSIWGSVFLIRRPIPASVMFSRQSWRGGMMVGCVSATMVLLSTYAYYAVDNPAYIPAIKFLDTIIIMGVYALWGRKNSGNLLAGFGVVACAAALIVLKAQIGS
ncbi:MAG: hypothetical protein ACXW4B_06600 [Micavibrio sp.]